MSKFSAPGAVVVAVALAVLGVGCGADDAGDTRETAASAGTTASAAPADTTAPADGEPGAPTTGESGVGAGTGAPSATPDTSSTPGDTPPELVRDAFAGLQATLNDSCDTPGNCEYFLGRVYDELHRMDRAMKADPKGPGHFPEPIELIEKLDGELDGDRSFENLKKHQSLLIGTRDRINTWMQGHPDDYR
ncbi:hypothetical protein [Streptomyces narbonensis]|uniref:hypothetical protein n=1 Tax=Streptomyces narbonensis TaxID=67333 RepID=UPI0016753372|nr:hypothetical protein [Streptomyces narbonensis]GGW09792.1 hypothetical protein GCM10010230_59770 [Streptomyces narbonensis]